jgi:hypothetical protein
MAYTARSLALLSLLALLAGQPAQAQRKDITLSVRVTLQGSGQPLAGAQAQVGSLPARLTDATGTARITGIAAGTHMVEVSMMGHERQQALVTFTEPGSTVEMDIALRVQPIEVEGLRVTSWGRNSKLQSNGFYQRQRMGSGTFLTRDDIEKRNVTALTEVFRDVRGFKLTPNSNGPGYVVESRRGRITLASGLQGCSPDVYLDGTRFPPESIQNLYIDPLHLISVHTVEAIEVYDGPASTPVQYRGPSTSSCGVVLVWTR